MKRSSSRRDAKTKGWPKRVKLGRNSVTIYRRKTPSGNFAYMLANYAGGKRRFESYPTQNEALEAANILVRRLSEREVVAAAMTNEQAADYASAIQALSPHDISLPTAASTLSVCLKLVGDLPSLISASKFYVSRHPSKLPRKLVKEVAEECLKAKETAGASPRYLQDLRHRLGRISDVFKCNISSVTGDQIQDWFDAEQLAPQSRINFRRIMHLFFNFAIRRGYEDTSPVYSGCTLVSKH